MSHIVIGEMPAFLQKRLIHRGEGSEKRRTPDPGITRGGFFRNHHKGIPALDLEIISVTSFPSGFLTWILLGGKKGGSEYRESQKESLHIPNIGIFDLKCG